MVAKFFVRVFKNKFLTTKFKQNNLIIGHGSDISRRCLFGKNNVIGENVTFVDSKLGDFTYISQSSFIVGTEIGKFCSIGPNVQCGLGKHPSKGYVSTHPIFYSTKKQAQITFANRDYFLEKGPIVIGNDVWIGANAIIADDLFIGDGAIIASGAVVTKNVAPYEIVGGVPAKTIRFRFSEDEIAQLLQFKWWDKDLKWIKDNYKSFHDVDKFFKLINQK